MHQIFLFNNNYSLSIKLETSVLWYNTKQILELRDFVSYVSFFRYN